METQLSVKPGTIIFSYPERSSPLGGPYKPASYPQQSLPPCPRSASSALEGEVTQPSS